MTHLLLKMPALVIVACSAGFWCSKSYGPKKMNLAGDMENVPHPPSMFAALVHLYPLIYILFH